MAEYLPRLVDELLSELLAELPAVLVVGPRATGKTTTAARLASTVVRLDRPAEAAVFRADPDAALASFEEPIVLDEWQEVPAVLGAVKRAIDVEPRPGRFLLTGSVRGDIEAETWPGTGRVIRVAMMPMTVRERLARTTRPFIDRVIDGEPLEPASPATDLRGYVALSLEGGFPELLRLSEQGRRRWIDSYVDQLLTRDAALVDRGRDPARLRRYLEAYALNSAGLVQDKTLYDAAGIDRRTAVAYEGLLLNLLVVDALPAWTSNRLKRLTLAPKRYLVDPALLAGIIGLTETAVLRDGDLLGRVLDTLVAAQLRAESEVARHRARLFHLRQEQGRREIDLVAEVGAERLVGIEVKATSAPDRSSASHLAWLRDRIGDRFVAGVVFHTGPAAFSLGDRITAAPISTLWA
ncbi:MAG TPA: ATP-binding protein [Acidimicrobiales bacterium]|nr:ATP-binding protein [Acidimicrobiales bacterium]